MENIKGELSLGINILLIKKYINFNKYIIYLIFIKFS
jgi:hypothetical protein